MSSKEAKENVLLFGVWDASGMECTDPSMSRYIKVTPIAHMTGRYASKQFRKSEISIAERLINRLMQTEDNTGHEQKTSKIVKDTFEIVNGRTEENPVQVPVHMAGNAGPREETARPKYGGISVPQAVDVALQRRVDEALKLITQGTLSGSHETTTTAAEALAQQLIGVVDYDVQMYVISQREGKECVAEAIR